MDGMGGREVTSFKLEELADKPEPEDTPQFPRSMAVEGPTDEPQPGECASLPPTVEPSGREEAALPEPDAEGAPAAEQGTEEPPQSGEAPPRALSSEEVTGHTASLWKYRPVPEEEPEPAPEYLFGETDYPGSRMIGARVRGKKHKHEGTNCDDWYETASLEDITFLVVSDGAGSKRFSRIGAQASCRAAAGYLVKAFAVALADSSSLREELRQDMSRPECMEACGVLAGLVQQSVIKAYEAVESACYQRVRDPAYQQVLGRALELTDLSSTLLVAVIVPLEKTAKEHLIITCQVGDGMIAALHTAGDFASSVKLMGRPDSGEFSGETEFLTSPGVRRVEALQSRTKLFRGPVDVVMAMTDGVADDYFPNETEMRRLYFDLTANGILREQADLSLPGLSQQQLRQFKKLPDPLSYPWVNDQSISISLHYTSRICEAGGLSLEDLWSDSGILELAQLEMDSRLKAVSPGERLKVWLDNYVERGSFDDRTLVIALM